MNKNITPPYSLVFHKIKKFEELEHGIIEAIEISCDADISPLVAQLYQTHQAPLGDISLGDFDTDNIQEWIQHQMDITQTRHAALVSNVLRVYGDKAFHVIKNCYQEHGTRAGLDARNSKDISSAPALYKAINDYLLHAMALKQSNQILIHREDRIQWRILGCPQRKYWERCHADIRVFYQLQKTWITNFISHANPKFTYSFLQKEVDGVNTLIHEISQ